MVWLKEVLDWLLSHKTATAIILLAVAVLVGMLYVGYLWRELAKKDTQLSVLKSQVEDQKVLQEIQSKLGENKQLQEQIFDELETLKEIDGYIHELNIEHQNDMDKIFKITKFPTFSSDAPVDTTMYDICEPPCECLCPRASDSP